MNTTTLYKSTLGSSHYGHRRSPPSYKFGTETSEQRQRTFIGQSAALHDPMVAYWTPGPGSYNTPGSMPQRLPGTTTPFTSPVRNSRSSAPASPHRHPRDNGSERLLPLSYAAPSSLSATVDSRIRHSWGPGPLSGYNSSDNNAAPVSEMVNTVTGKAQIPDYNVTSERGSYYVDAGGGMSGALQPLSTIGRPTVNSRQRTAQRACWTGYSLPEQESGRYISRGHERENLCRTGPGPATAKVEVYGSVGVPNVDSRRQFAPRIVFARGSRFEFVAKNADKSNWPGPGAYDC